MALRPGMTGSVNVTVEIPWHAQAGDTQFLALTAGTAQTTITTTAALAAGWEDLLASPHAASDLAVVYNGGHLYQIGGYDGGYYGGVHAYEIAAGTWSPKSPMLAATARMDGAAIEGNIYVPGGQTADSA
ncbi:MAG: hypothetical protein M8467_14480, partial [Anaerolineae bacterium]|nr:hypothetical protein [Anaerolineae bacterium]